MDLDATASQFDWTPHLLPQSGGRPRRASFTDGREASLVFMWEPAGVSNPRVYLIKTEAPFVIEQLQRAFGAGIDGKFGDLTRKAVINGLRAAGYNYADTAPVSVPFMADALAYGLFGGGRVAFPAAVDLPNISSPRRATNPSGRDSTLFSAYDVATGQAVPLVANGPRVVPQNANEPAPTTINANTTNNTTNNYTTPGTQTIPGQTVPGMSMLDPSVFNPLTIPGQTMPGQTTDGYTTPYTTPGTQTIPGQTVPGMSMLDPSVFNPLTIPGQTMPGQTTDGYTTPYQPQQPQLMPVLTPQQQQILLSLNPQQVQTLVAQYGPWVQQVLFSLNGGANVALGCDKGSVDDKGMCVGGYVWVDGRLLIPAAPGAPAVDYANPNTYGKRVLDNAKSEPGKALAPILGTGLTALLLKLASQFYGV